MAADETPDVDTPDVAAPDVDALVAELQARVETRRAEGAYPPGLEAELAEHYERIVAWHPRSRAELDERLDAKLDAVRSSLAFDARRVPVESGLPGGAALHKLVNKAVARQIQGALDQVRANGEAVEQVLSALVRIVRDLQEQVPGAEGDGGVPLDRRLDALAEELAEQERALAALRAR